MVDRAQRLPPRREDVPGDLRARLCRLCGSSVHSLSLFFRVGCFFDVVMHFLVFAAMIPKRKNDRRNSSKGGDNVE